MYINWFGYYNQNDGYGRFNSRMVRALQRYVPLEALHIGLLDMPDWLLFQQNILIGQGTLNITCTPPYMVKKVLGPHWLYTMTEGSRIPQGWVDAIEGAGVERVLVPCIHNLHAFRNSGVSVPISVVPGGTDPNEFPIIEKRKFCLEDYYPYTFLCFADRGDRKGFPEVWEAFYRAFGGKTEGNQNVRLIIKGRMKDKSVLAAMSRAQDADKRIVYQESDALDMYDIYAQADCIVVPSRSEGWGMIHREAACMGLPVITQAYSGLDDAENWAYTVSGATAPIPSDAATMLGEWKIADKDDLAQKMLFCYHSPETAAAEGRRHAQWIRREQTWEHSAKTLVSLMGITNAISVEDRAVPVFS